jgi:hypothetical protein
MISIRHREIRGAKNYAPNRVVLLIHKLVGSASVRVLDDQSRQTLRMQVELRLRAGPTPSRRNVASLVPLPTKFINPPTRHAAFPRRRVIDQPRIHIGQHPLSKTD